MYDDSIGSCGSFSDETPSCRSRGLSKSKMAAKMAAKNSKNIYLPTTILSLKAMKQLTINITTLIQPFKMVYKIDCYKVKVKVISRSNHEKSPKKYISQIFLLPKTLIYVKIMSNTGSSIEYDIFVHFQKLYVCCLVTFRLIWLIQKV